MSKTEPEGDVDAHVPHDIEPEPFHADSARPSAVSQPADQTSADSDVRSTAIATAAMVGVVAVGAVIFEAALIPGLILGAAAALAPQYAPQLGTALNPLFRSTVRGVYKLGQKSREMFAEAQQQMSDIAAQVSAEELVKTNDSASVEPKPAAL